MAEGCLAQSESAEVDDIILAVGDHLVSDLDEKSSHTLIGVIITSDGVNHLDGVHQGRQGLFDGFGCAFVKGFDKLLKSLKVLDVVLCLIESFSHTKLDASPLAGCKMKLVFRSVSAFTGTSSGSSENIQNLDAVFGCKLLRNAGQLSHALLPILKFLAGTSLFVVLFLRLGFFKSLFDFFRPLVEDFFEVIDHVRVDGLGVGGDSTLGWLKGQSIFLPLLGVRVEDDVGLK